VSTVPPTSRPDVASRYRHPDFVNRSSPGCPARGSTLFTAKRATVASPGFKLTAAVRRRRRSNAPLDTFIPFTYDALSLTQPVLISQLPAMRKRRGRFGGANG